jgi:hypothetical protein
MQLQQIPEDEWKTNIGWWVEKPVRQDRPSQFFVVSRTIFALMLTLISLTAR